MDESPNIQAEIAKALREGGKLHAIGVCRRLLGYDLLAAKSYVDNLGRASDADTRE